VTTERSDPGANKGGERADERPARLRP